jgi:SAM-dependent methyltransferase
MLGEHIARAYPAPLRWIYRYFGFPNIHDRQRWDLLWPILREFRGRRARILDIGCGSGRWVLELASRAPEWSIIGIDRNPELIDRAEQLRRRLGIANARFEAEDCLASETAGHFDVVLSVNSAHYALPAGRGHQLFARFREWLSPTSGVLVLLAPRCAERRVETGAGTGPAWPGFVSTEQVAHLCETTGLAVHSLTPCIGRLGILAKRLALIADRSVLLGALLYPAQLAFSHADRKLAADARRSAALLLIASRAPGSGRERGRSLPLLKPEAVIGSEQMQGPHSR